MKSGLVISSLVVCLSLGLVLLQQTNAGAEQVDSAETTAPAAAPAQPHVFAPAPETFAKKCSFNSDCPYGKCKKGRCGGCSFNSDCKGWGKCKKGWCGGCSFDSDCKGFGKCTSGKCTKSPY
jgi:hypothetical protein